jgi:GlcNAc-P-P-Und epimerase
MMITLIGGSGFVGTRLIKEIKEESCINIDKNPSAFFNKITSIGDVRDKSFSGLVPHHTDVVILLAAEHKDDVTPTSLYYDVNVEGTRNVLETMDRFGIKKIIFTSSVAIYGLNKLNPDESHPADPFNHYGKSKWQAEELLREWYNKDPQNHSLTIIRPTVIFGERNRGNVYNLLKQIASGNFMRIGKGTNRKSMAYVGNIVAFIQYCIKIQKPGYRLFNYIDKPDLNMNELVQLIETSLGKKLPAGKLPYWLGYMIGLCFDLISRITGRKFSVSSLRIKKFCATTQFAAKAAQGTGFQAPYTLTEGLRLTLQYEFIDPPKNEVVFESE